MGFGGEPGWCGSYGIGMLSANVGPAGYSWRWMILLSRVRVDFDRTVGKITLPGAKGNRSAKMFHRYDYEAEFYPSLSRLPLDLRRKLDLSGIKLSLKDWLAISLEERTVLCHLPCDHDEERQAFATLRRFSRQEIPL